MMAQAGATFNVRGIQPFHNPGTPSVLNMCQRNLGMDLSSGARILLVPSLTRGWSLKTCCRVLPTSNGVVRTDAIAPDMAPAVKLSVNVAVWFSRLCDLARARLRGPSVSRLRPRDFSRASVSLPLIVSYPHQYIPEKGTSRQRVNVRPLQSVVYPWDCTMSPIPLRVSEKCPAAVTDVLACIRVLNISIGLTTIAATIRAIDPATSGA